MSKSQVIFQSNFATLQYLPDLNCPLIKFIGLVNHDKYKEVLEKAYDLIIEKKLNNWISDLSKMNVILPENQKWTNEYLLPKVLSTTTINKVAIIVSDDVFTQATLGKIMDEVEKARLPIRYFNKFEDIEPWFKEKVEGKVK